MKRLYEAGCYFGLDVDNIFLGLLFASLLVSPGVEFFVSAINVIFQPIDAKTSGDGGNGHKVSETLFLVGLYGEFQVYLPRIYHGVDVRALVLKKVQESNRFPSAHPVSPKNEKNHYHIARAGFAIEAIAFFEMVDEVMKIVRETPRQPLVPAPPISVYRRRNPAPVPIIINGNDEDEPFPYVYISRYGQKWNFTSPSNVGGRPRNALDFFHAIQVFDEGMNRYKYPCSPDSIIDIGGTIYCPVDLALQRRNPESLYIPIVKFYEKGAKYRFSFLIYSHKVL
jgi:hypothetical protein